MYRIVLVNPKDEHGDINVELFINGYFISNITCRKVDVDEYSGSRILGKRVWFYDTVDVLNFGSFTCDEVIYGTEIPESKRLVTTGGSI
jgi:hypothetical protein